MISAAFIVAALAIVGASLWLAVVPIVRDQGTRCAPGNRKTVAVDFDGVLHSYTSPWVAPHVIPDPPVEGAMGWLTEIGRDFDVVIFTTRGRTWRGRRAVRRWLRAWRPEGDAPYRITDRKPAALLYVDDRAHRFTGEFPSAGYVRAALPWNKRPR